MNTISKTAISVLTGIVLVNMTQATLVAEWKFNEGSGTSAIDSTNGYHGTLSASASWTTNGVDGSAVDCAGVGEVVIPVEAFATISNEVTLSMWVFGSKSQPINDVCFTARDSNERVLNVNLPWSDSDVYFDAGNTGSLDFDRISGTSVEARYKGQWNHWVFTKDAIASNMNIYVNGEIFQSATGLTKPMLGNTITMAYIGSGGGANYYNGMIDEVQLHDESLNDEQVLTLFESYGYTVINLPPTADSQSVAVNQNSSADITLTGEDLDGDTLTFNVIDNPTNGVLTGEAPDLVYTPNTDYIGMDSFTFDVDDGTTNSEPAIVTITVSPVASNTVLVAEYNFNDSNLSNSVNTAGVTASIGALGDGLNENYAGVDEAIGLGGNRDAFFGTGAGTLEASLLNNKYFSFTVTPDVGSLLKFAELNFTLQANHANNSITSYAVFSSIGGFEAGNELATGSVTTLLEANAMQNNLSALPEVTTATEFRIYLYGASGSSSSSFSRLDNVQLSVENPEEPGVGLISIEVIAAGTQIKLSWTTTYGELYGVMAMNDLQYGTWSNIVTDVIGTGGKVTVTNSVSTQTEFYRAYLQE